MCLPAIILAGLPGDPCFPEMGAVRGRGVLWVAGLKRDPQTPVSEKENLNINRISDCVKSGADVSQKPFLDFSWTAMTCYFHQVEKHKLSLIVRAIP
jgi:hypothetical protein